MHLVPSFEFQHGDNVSSLGRDDEFDFEIGGDENLDPVGLAEDENEHAVDQPEHTSPHDPNIDVDAAFNDQLEEEVMQATVDSYDQEARDPEHQSTEAEISTFDKLEEAVGLANSPEYGGSGGDEHHYQDNDDDEDHAEVVLHEDVEYLEANADVDIGGSENAVQSEIDGDHNLIDAATSVQHLADEEDGPGDLADEAATETGLETVMTEVEVDIKALEDGEYLASRTEVIEETVQYEEEELDDARDSSYTAGVHADSSGGQSAEASAILEEPPAEDLDDPSEEPAWNADPDEQDDQENEDLTSRPNVTVSYQGRDYFLFAENSDEDPDTYFLDDVEAIQQPLSQFLGHVREVISSEVEMGHEIFLKIDGLGLEFGESTAKDFLDHTTFAQIIDVNNKLVQQDGGSKSPELYVYLSVRSNPVYRFSELAKGAEEGHGLSTFEKYYDETSADISAAYDDGQDDLAQDVLSDDVSIDDIQVEPDISTAGSGDPPEAHQHQNPFSVGIDAQEPLVDTLDMDERVLEAGGAEEANEALLDLEQATTTFGENDNIDANPGVEDINRLEVEASRADGMTFDTTLEDALSDSGQVEGDMDESWNDGQDAGGESAEAIPLPEQPEAQIHFSEDTHDSTHGENTFSFRTLQCVEPGLCLCDTCYASAPLDLECVSEAFSSKTPTSVLAKSNVSMPISGNDWNHSMLDFDVDNTGADIQFQDIADNEANDEDYLDLGEDNEAADDDTTERFEMLQPQSHSSSASATLDGEDSGHGDDLTADQSLAVLTEDQEASDIDAAKPEVDEIDWNHDDENENGEDAQNPTGDSPSPSAKRSRQEAEDTSGSGDENGMCWTGVVEMAHADIASAVKRRRT